MKGRFMRSIRGKILISILLITLLTSLAVTMIFYGQSARTIEENYISSLQQRAQQMMDELDEAVERAYHVNLYASCDDRIKKSIWSYLEANQTDQQEEELEKLAQLLYEYKAQSHAVSSVYLLIPEAQLVVTSEEYPVYRKEISENKIEEVEKKMNEDASPMLIEDLIYENEMLFSCIETVKDEEGSVLGYVFSNIRESKLYYDYIAGWDENEIKDSVILDSQRRMIAGSQINRMGKLYQEKQYEKWIGGKKTEGSDRENIYIYCESTFAQIGLFTVVDKAAVLSDLLWIRWFFFGVLAVFMAIALILALYLSHIIYRPLKQLTLTMGEISGGNLQTRAQVESGDEIGELAMEFNEMLDKIEELIAQLIEEEKKKKDMELEALQYQITPHFMYNTLNSIKYAALLKGEKEIGQIIGDFVELLQAAVSKKGVFLTVAEEIHILENYIRLQKFRYGGGFEVTYQVAEEVQTCLVPRLILQPLVENALMHGLDMKQGTD